MQKKVAIIHTSFVSVEELKRLFGEIAPSVKVYHIVDDSLLQEVLANGGVTEGVAGRMTQYAKQAESIGVDLVLNQCSSVGEAAATAREHIDVPLLRVDEAMAEEAVARGKRIGVVATLETTLGPTVRLIEAKAREAGQEVAVTSRLCAGAFDCLVQGNRDRHNEMVLQAIRELAAETDVVVLAQGSMVALLPLLDANPAPVPVLTSLRSGVRRAADMLLRM
ncbi:aspartate/glutamate racemase family protein [Paenibacillus cymbidii]|uniref:aspartate/glutamate racemase family protein n=1 Tax=Paenibacillus cymbidii TaxID=1639034 RepID=UPI00107FEEB7|nr:aspartate/glutamate racemase family protein [Paenibacillus cymbidii]